MAGESEEDVVERGLVNLHVVDRDACVIERAHDRRGHPGAVLEWCAQPASVVARVHVPGDERRER